MFKKVKSDFIFLSLYFLKIVSRIPRLYNM